jgi:hypothetical protein
MTPEDLRAAVAAGIIDEAQAASLNALAQRRAGQRTALPAEDEPFEFFRGFSEIFVSLGLIILMTGIALMLSFVGGQAIFIAVPAIVAAVAWWWAGYFTLKRRMTLPSMVLASAFGTGVAFSAGTLLTMAMTNYQVVAVLALLLSALAMAGWYRRFRLPFSMFILGAFVLAALYVATDGVSTAFFAGMRDGNSMGNLFDLRDNPVFATTTLVFGIGAFVAAMWFDTRDPNRLGRHSATAFWLHLLAAPALVNTTALSLSHGGGSGAMALLAVALLGIAALALIIDRRSFLTAAIVYIATVLGWLVGDGAGFGSWSAVIIVLGALITALGTWWILLRGWLMLALPEFPGKTRLPPYEHRS